MAECFPYRFIDIYGEVPDKTKTWRRMLQGITPAQLAEGFQVIRDKKLEWPVGPQVFRGMCLPTPEKWGKLRVEAAYVKMCQVTKSGALSSSEAVWTDVEPAVYHAYMAIDKTTLKEAPAKFHRQLFIDAYSGVMERVYAGEDLPPVPLAITHDDTPRERAEHKERVAGIAALRRENKL